MVNDINSKIIDSFGGCGHYLQLHEINFPLCKNSKFIFTDEMVVPKEEENGDYELDLALAYISKAYDSKEEAESSFSNLRLCYAIDANTLIDNNDTDENNIVPIRSSLGEKYMDSIMDEIVTITDITRTDDCNLNSYEAGFDIDFNIKFKINDTEFTAEVYTIYGDYTDGENPNISITIYKDKIISAFITDEFDLYYDKENGYLTAAKIKSNNNIIATYIGDDKLLVGYSIPENFNINLTSLGRYFVNRIYKEVNGMLNTVEQGS